MMKVVSPCLAWNSIGITRKVLGQGSQILATNEIYLESCICYLMLWGKNTSKLSGLRDKNSEEAWLAIWFRVYRVVVRCPAGAAIIGKLDWEHRFYFPGGPLMWLAIQCWLLLESPSSSSCGPLHRAAAYPHSMVSSFLLNPTPASKEKSSRSCNAFHNMPLEVTHCQVCCIHLVSLTQCGGRLKGMNTR